MNAYGVGLGTSHRGTEPEAPVARTASKGGEAEPLRMRFGTFVLDEQNASLVCDGRAVEIAPKPFALLCALLRRPGRLRTKNELLDEVWGHRFVTESVIKTVIGKLRIALQDDARIPRFIETVPRRGYRFIAGETVAPREAATISPERAVRQIGELLQHFTGRKPLLLLIDQADGSDRTADLMDYIARWTPRLTDDASLSAP